MTIKNVERIDHHTGSGPGKEKRKKKKKKKLYDGFIDDWDI